MSTANAQSIDLDITGLAAIDIAERDPLGVFTLNKRADPIQGAVVGIGSLDARLVAAEDPGLIYLVARGAWYGTADYTLFRVGGLSITVQSPDFRPGQRFCVHDCDLEDACEAVNLRTLDPDMADLAAEALTEHLQ